MCGIFCSIRPATAADTSGPLAAQQHTETLRLLRNRGPDRAGQLHVQSTAGHRLHFCAQVLWQQGAEPCAQPRVSHADNDDGHKNVLLWNGDVFTQELAAEQRSTSDTEWLLEALDACETEPDMAELFRQHVRGPFALVFFDGRRQTLYVARDSLGRQSLLIGRQTTGDDSVIISSVMEASSREKEVIELPSLGLFSVQLADAEFQWSLIPWQALDTHESYAEQLADVQRVVGHRIRVDKTLCIDPEWMRIQPPAIQSSHSTRWSFETILREFDDLKTSRPDEIFERLLRHPHVRSTVEELTDLLAASVRERCLATPPKCRDCVAIDDDRDGCRHSRIGVLFSGGLDCTILAVLADRVVPAQCPIDLLNVSFERVRKAPQQHTSSNGEATIEYRTPDRVSALQSAQELRMLLPMRVWNLVESNVTRAELNAAIAERIAHLVHPLNTVLDESLGAALWFAARGRGELSSTADYTSPVRVLLHGSGADELFGGYTRHRNAFVRCAAAAEETGSAVVGAWRQLHAELELDWRRLPARNLARDDRCTADHGRTARAPYVQERVVRFARSLRAEQRCYFGGGMAAGVGDKLLLRLVGYQLGLRAAAALPKRALQFGSRIADSRQNAKDKSAALGAAK